MAMLDWIYGIEKAGKSNPLRHVKLKECTKLTISIQTVE